MLDEKLNAQIDRIYKAKHKNEVRALNYFLNCIENNIEINEKEVFTREDLHYINKTKLWKI